MPLLHPTAAATPTAAASGIAPMDCSMTLPEYVLPAKEEDGDRGEGRMLPASTEPPPASSSARHTCLLEEGGGNTTSLSSCTATTAAAAAAASTPRTNTTNGRGKRKQQSSRPPQRSTFFAEDSAGTCADLRLLMLSSRSDSDSSDLASDLALASAGGGGGGYRARKRWVAVCQKRARGALCLAKSAARFLLTSLAAALAILITYWALFPVCTYSCLRNFSDPPSSSESAAASSAAAAAAAAGLVADEKGRSTLYINQLQVCMRVLMLQHNNNKILPGTSFICIFPFFLL